MIQLLHAFGCGKKAFIFSKGRCADCARIEDTGKKIEAESEKMIQKENLSDLIAQADRIVSRYVRLKAASRDGICKCYTCDKEQHWSMCDAGHYLKRGHLFLRFDVERNLRVQCKECNQVKGGNMAEFSRRLEKENPGLTDFLKEEAALVYKPTREEIRAIISEYTARVREIKIKLLN